MHINIYYEIIIQVAEIESIQIAYHGIQKHNHSTYSDLSGQTKLDHSKSLDHADEKTGIKIANLNEKSAVYMYCTSQEIQKYHVGNE